jgi:hypothetical protein
MAKAILYLGLSAVGIVLGLFSPLWGAIACIDAYLFNPSVMELPDGGFRYQLWINLVFIIGWVIHWPKGVDRVGQEGWLIKSLWIFVAFGFASAAWAYDNPQLALNTFYEVFKTALFAALLVRVIRSQRDLSFVIMAVLIGVAHASFMHVFGTRYGYVPPIYGRENGVLPDAQTSVMVIFVPLLLVLAMMGQKYERIVSWLALPIVLDSIVVTYQRTGFVALGVELVLMLLFLPMRIKIRMAPGLMIGLVLFVFRLTPADYWDWVDTIKNPTQEGSADSRFHIGAASWRMLKDYPFGVGYRNYMDVVHNYLEAEWLFDDKRTAHNSYFTIACETGIEGFIPWISAFLGACWMLRKIRKRADLRNPTRVEIYAMGMEIGLYGWIATGFFHNEQEVDPAYWLVALAVVLTRLNAQKTDNAPAEESSPGELPTSSQLIDQHEVPA